MQTIAINYYFSENELGNRIFSTSSASDKAAFMRAFREFMVSRGVAVVTVDQVDFRDPSVSHVLYFDYSWRSAKTDRFLANVPFEKRVLVTIEPALVNPSLFFVSHYRRRFKTVFTWHEGLLKKNPAYVRINVPVGADPLAYVENRFESQTFRDKRYLVAVSSNRWRYMPHSAYGLRLSAYQYFSRAHPESFDLYGTGWDQPLSFWERVRGRRPLNCYRGAIHGGYDAKVEVVAKYKYALCFENNGAEPGYISEKIIDCFCARCVPVYYGWKGAAERIPPAAWIDLRRFSSFRELDRFLSGIGAEQYWGYLQAIDRFMASEQMRFFTMDHFFNVIYNKLRATETAI